MKLNDDYIFYDASDLFEPRLYLLNCINNDIIIIYGRERERFIDCLSNHPSQENVEFFKEFGFFYENK